MSAQKKQVNQIRLRLYDLIQKHPNLHPIPVSMIPFLNIVKTTKKYTVVDDIYYDEKKIILENFSEQDVSYNRFAEKNVVYSDHPKICETYGTKSWLFVNSDLRSEKYTESIRAASPVYLTTHQSFYTELTNFTGTLAENMTHLYGLMTTMVNRYLNLDSSQMPNIKYFLLNQAKKNEHMHVYTNIYIEIMIKILQRIMNLLDVSHITYGGFSVDPDTILSGINNIISIGIPPYTYDDERFSEYLRRIHHMTINGYDTV